MSSPLLQFNGNVAGSPPPSFVFGGSQIMGPGTDMTLTQGSTAGVPAPANATGQVADLGMSSTKEVLSQAQAVTARHVWDQPVFWLFVELVIGVFMLGHIAHVSVKA